MEKRLADFSDWLKNCGDFSITNSLKFGFSLFCPVLLLAFFSVSVFISYSFNLVCFFAVIGN